MSNEVTQIEEWHCIHHARGSRQIFGTEAEAQAVASEGDSVKRFVRDVAVPHEAEPASDDIDS